MPAATWESTSARLGAASVRLAPLERSSSGPATATDRCEKENEGHLSGGAKRNPV